MQRNPAARAATVLAMIVFVICATTAPALAGHDDGSDDYRPDDYRSDDYETDERAGRGPDITIEVECYSVEVESPKEISTVTVYFTDGTEEVIEVEERTYSGTFETTIDHAVAESHKTTADDEAEDCEPAPEPGEAPAEPDDDGGSSDAGGDGDDSSTTQTRTTQTRTTQTRTSTDNDGRTASTATSTSSSPVSTARKTDDATAPTELQPATPEMGTSLSVGGNAHVLGMAFHQVIKRCPSGPYKGMQYVNIKDCGDAVLGKLLSRTGSEVGTATALGLGLIALGALLLRFRRPSGVA